MFHHSVLAAGRDFCWCDDNNPVFQDSALMRRFIAIVLLAFGCAVARGEESVSAELLPSLKEVVFMQLLESHVPKDYFTVAMDYEPRHRIFVAPSEKFIKKMLRIKDMGRGRFVCRESLWIPVEQDMPSPNGSYPGVVKKGTDKRVSVYRAVHEVALRR